MSLSALYYSKFAAAYVRGAAIQKQPTEPPLILASALLEKSLEKLAADEFEEILMAGKAAELKLYRFKNTHDDLPRVKRVLGFLKSVEMDNLLDVGSGRGVFLWPCLSAFPRIRVTSLDILTHRIDLLNTVKAGGIANLNAIHGDICDTTLADKSYDIVTMLEVLEHIPDIMSAISSAVRIAKKYVVISVPSKPDNNPEHIRLFSKNMLTELFNYVGCTQLHFDGVQGHLIMIAVLEE